MTNLDDIQQAESDRRAELRAILMAGRDTSATRVAIKGVKQRRQRAAAKIADEERRRLGIKAFAAQALKDELLAELQAALDSKYPPLEQVGGITLDHEGPR